MLEVPKIAPEAEIRGFYASFGGREPGCQQFLQRRRAAREDEREQGHDIQHDFNCFILFLYSKNVRKKYLILHDVNY